MDTSSTILFAVWGSFSFFLPIALCLLFGFLGLPDLPVRLALQFGAVMHPGQRRKGVSGTVFNGLPVDVVLDSGTYSRGVTFDSAVMDVYKAAVKGVKGIERYFGIIEPEAAHKALRETCVLQPRLDAEWEERLAKRNAKVVA